MTQRGMKLMEEAYKHVNVNKYSCEVEEMETFDLCMVSRLAAYSNMYSVNIPRESIYGSQFGKCKWGVPQCNGKSCVHMIVLAKGGQINDLGFTRLSVMPHWNLTAIWRNRFPEDGLCHYNWSAPR